MLSTQTRGMARLYALDVTRAIAVMGMVLVNVGPRDGEGPASWLIRASHGRASILFVILAGIGVSLLARHALNHGVTRRSTLLWRGLLMLLMGLALQLLDHDVSVILPTYAALFLIAALVVRMPTAWLLAGACAMAIAGPVTWIAVKRSTGFEIESAGLTDSPWEILAAIVITGPYPLVVWVAPFLLGMWLGRLRLGNMRLQIRLFLAGTAAAFGGYILSRVLVRIFGEPSSEIGFDRLISAVGHSQMPLWLVSSTGTALMLLGALLVVVPYLNKRIRLLVAVGQMPLTTYVAHLVIIALLVRPGPETAWAGVAVSALIIAALVVFAVVWIANMHYGPLEVLLRRPPAFLRVAAPRAIKRSKARNVYPRPRHRKIARAEWPRHRKHDSGQATAKDTEAT